MAPPGNQAVNGENKHQPDVSEETGLLDYIIRGTCLWTSILIYLQLSDDEGERRKKYRQFVREMVKEKEAMKGEMDRRIMYGGKDLVEEMTKTCNISEKIKQMGRQTGWRKNKENRPL